MSLCLAMCHTAAAFRVLGRLPCSFEGRIPACFGGDFRSLVMRISASLHSWRKSS